MYSTSLKPTGRVASIDILRALTMYFMLFVNDLPSVKNIPEWLRHVEAGVDGMGFSDVIFPLFLFIVGMSIPLATNARRKKGDDNFKVSIHILTRTFALIAMGFFMVNLENINREILPIDKNVWQILMALAFVLIWNMYEKGTYWDKISHWIPKALGVLILVYLAYIYKSGPNDAPTWLESRWWGILGLIGWAYLLNAFIYLFAGHSLVIISGAWIVLHFLQLADFADSLNFFSVPLMVGKSNHILVMSGVVASMVFQKFGKEESKTRFLTVLGALAVVTIVYGFLLRPYWGIAKIGGTPSWTDICSGIGFASFAVLYVITDMWGKSGWAVVFTPAGRSTLTCYLVPYFYYAVRGLGDLYLPEYLRSGMIGITKSLIYSFIVIAITWGMERIYLRLKI